MLTVALYALVLTTPHEAHFGVQPKTHLCWMAPVKGSAGVQIRNCRSFTSPTGGGPGAADPPNAPPQTVDPGDDDDPPRNGRPTHTPPGNKPTQSGSGPRVIAKPFVHTRSN